jgi:cytochrome c oxidase subunit 1
MNPTIGKVHFWLTFVFYNMTFFPMHQLGLQGHMRRIYDPTIYQFLEHLGGLNRFITISAFLLFASQILFVINFIGSWFKGKKASENPWEDTGLEWTTPSPPPHGNWAVTPVVYHPPYEFSHPMVKEDFLLQSRPLEPPTEPAQVPPSQPARQPAAH